MKNKLALILAIVILLLIVSCKVNNNQIVENTDVSNPNNLGNVSMGYETKSSGDTSDGSASITLTPLEINDDTLVMQIEMNTHSVDLSKFDLKEITILEYDGNKINPIEGPSLSGHHSSGNLVFNTDKKLKEYKVTIQGIPSIETRVFEWR